MWAAKFLESVSGKLAEQWIATMLTPAFVFWAWVRVVGNPHQGER
jgi:hypothetical protein